MIRNYTAVATLIRNRLNANKPFEEIMYWFHERGVSIEVLDKDLFILKSEKNGHTSKLTEICQKGLIYRGPSLICFMGEEILEVKFEELQEYSKITWDENTHFLQSLEGRDIYMFHDPKINNWAFADNKNSQSSYKRILIKYLYNIMNVDIAFTYHFKLIEKGSNSGIYLWSLIQTKNGKERNYDFVHSYCIRLKAGHHNIYEFEGLDKLEENDFPLIAQDSSFRKIEIIK